MAVELKLLTTNPGTLTDLRPGRVRRTIYTEGSPAITPLAALLIGLTAAPLITGAGRALLGGANRNEAREKLETELLAAKIAGEKAQVQEIQGKLALLAREFDPTSEEERTLKLSAIREALPLDLARREVTIEAERANIAREDALFPLVMDARRLANENLAALTAERGILFAEQIQASRVNRENVAAETAKTEALTAQLEQNAELVRTAIGPLDQAQASQFLRERLFPEPKPRALAPIGVLSFRGPVVAGAGF